jgi:hypothetical protein
MMLSMKVNSMKVDPVIISVVAVAQLSCGSNGSFHVTGDDDLTAIPTH